MEHMNHIQDVVETDLETIKAKESTYGGSWKKREASVFHMIARMWDRVENITDGGREVLFDIIRQQEYGISDGQMLAILADLRRYLTLIEAQMRAEAAGDKPMSFEEWKTAKSQELARDTPTSEDDEDQKYTEAKSEWTPPKLKIGELSTTTEAVNDLQPGSVVPPEHHWLAVGNPPMSHMGFYIYEKDIDRFILKQTVSPQQYKNMPHGMQALYTIVQGQPRMTREAIAQRTKMTDESTSAI
jgi:hypothetical protein